MGYANTRTRWRRAWACWPVRRRGSKARAMCPRRYAPSAFAVGLLRHTSALYSLPTGFFRVASIFLLLAGMALARIKSMEQLRYVATGGRGEPVGIGPHPRKRADLPVFSKSRGGELRARPPGWGS
jgi:hypothetical protein